MVNFMNKFSPCLVTLATPLRELTYLHEEYIATDGHPESFRAMQQEFGNLCTLPYSDAEAFLQMHASKKGLAS